MAIRRPITLFLVILSFYIKSNGQVPPPPMAMPVDSNALLVDSIIKVTKHEQYFRDYCREKVLAHARINNWTEEKTGDILESVQFRYYNSTIYNSYAFYSTDQLRKLLDALKELARTSRDRPFILTNDMMQHNLDLFVASAIAGKYVVK